MPKSEREKTPAPAGPGEAPDAPGADAARQRSGAASDNGASNGSAQWVEWARDRASTSADALKRMPPAWKALSLVLVGLLLFLVFPSTISDHVRLVMRTLGLSSPSGLIAVDAPQVFTRQRLVNDRLIEDRWLARQLARTDELLENGRFSAPSQVVRGAARTTLTVGMPANAEQVVEGPQPPADGLESQLAPAEEFEQARSYRDTIRYAKIASQLDDGHDIDSNTIYRLNFAISVVPSGPFDDFAGIQMSLEESHDLEGLKTVYGRLLAEYAGEVQSVIRNVTSDRIATLQNGQYFAPQDSEHVRHFIRHQTELALHNLIPSPSDEMVPTTRASQLRAERFIQTTTNAITKARDRSDNLVNARVFEAAARSIGIPVEQWIGKFVSLCRVSPYVDLRSMLPNPEPGRTYPVKCEGRPPNWSLRVEFELVAALRALVANYHGLSDLSLAPYPEPDPELCLQAGGRAGPHEQTIGRSGVRPCPLDAGSISNAVVALLYPPSPPPGGLIQQFTGMLWPSPPAHPLAQTVASLPPRLARAVVDTNDALHDGGLLRTPDITFVVASYVLATMSQMKNEQSIRLLDLSSMFEFELVNCSVRQCPVRATLPGVVMDDLLPPNTPAAAKERSEHAKAKQAAQVYAHIYNLYKFLNCGSVVQTYSITPKKASSIGRANWRADQSGRMGVRGPWNARLTVDDSTEVGEATPLPLIVGFGDWGELRDQGPSENRLEIKGHAATTVTAEDVVCRNSVPQQISSEGFLSVRLGELRKKVDAKTRFGWIVLPVPRMGNSGLVQAHRANSINVTAIVSVPSWWRMVDIDIKTCWIARDEVSKVISPSDICEGEKVQDNRLSLKLPGSSSEILQRMAFFPIKAPYLDRNLGGRNEVEIGRTGQVTLKGARLWKNPRVKLGHQWADAVEVLPDMNGIVATYDCVLPSPGADGASNRSGSGMSAGLELPVSVWTSEGVTSVETVLALPFSPRLGHSASSRDLPCWVRQPEQTALPPALPYQ